MEAPLNLRGRDPICCQIFDALQALVVVFNFEGKVVMVNSACQNLMGYNEAEFQEIDFWDKVLLPEERNEVQAVFIDLKKGNYPSQHTNHWISKSGEKTRALIALRHKNYMVKELEKIAGAETLL